MNSLVTNECGVVPKEFPTFIALKRPFSGVNFLVLNKVKLSNEGHPTFAAFIRSYSSVDLLVLGKDLFLAEGFPTLSALVIILSSFKGLPMLSVPVWFQRMVRGQVLEKAFAACEATPCHANAVVHWKGRTPLIPSGKSVFNLLLLVLVQVCPTNR